MFYSQYILAKRGPLGTIWIAAHLDRRLRKQQITETDIAEAVRESPIHRPSPEFFRLASQNSSFSVGRAASPGGARDSSRGGFDRVEPGETRERSTRRVRPHRPAPTAPLDARVPRNHPAPVEGNLRPASRFGFLFWRFGIPKASRRSRADLRARPNPPSNPRRVHHQPRRAPGAAPLRPAHARRRPHLQPQGQLPLPRLLRGDGEDQVRIHQG